MADSPKQIAEDICMYAKVPEGIMRDDLIRLIEEAVEAERKSVKVGKRHRASQTFENCAATPTRKGEWL